MIFIIVHQTKQVKYTGGSQTLSAVYCGNREYLSGSAVSEKSFDFIEEEIENTGKI